MRELALHVLDLLENAVDAHANRIELYIDEDLARDILSITVKDDGRGMTKETLSRVLDPFYTTRTTRHVGLGLPLFAAAAQRCNGSLSIDSEPGVGTVVTAVFQHSHIDRAPLGNVGASLLAVLLSDRPIDLYYRHQANGQCFELDTVAIREQLADVPLSHPLVREWLQEVLADDLHVQQALL